jgi:CD2 antigen cytoplasmic tail-binding protein 2
LNSFQNFQKKKYELDEEQPEDRIDESDPNKESDNEEGSEDSELANQTNQTNQTDLFKQILSFLKPNENILTAIKRLGKSNTNKTSASMSASQRWLKKKPSNGTSGASSRAEDEAKIKEDAFALDKLTNLANQFIDMGYYDIYEETYEKINYKLSTEMRDKESAAHSQFDIFADDVDADVLETKTESVSGKGVEGEWT